MAAKDLMTKNGPSYCPYWILKKVLVWTQKVVQFSKLQKEMDVKEWRIFVSRAEFEFCRQKHGVHKSIIYLKPLINHYFNLMHRYNGSRLLI